MANRKITVLNPAGYQELFQTGDNLVVDGSVNLQSNGLTGVPTPSINLDAANKSYVDTKDGELATDITDLEDRIQDVEDLIAGSAPGNATIDFTGTSGISITGDSSFQLNQSVDATINIQGPDLSSFLDKPGTDGTFLITESSGTISYTEVVDGGTYS